MNTHIRLISLVVLALLLTTGCGKRFVEEEEAPEEPVTAMPAELQLSEAELATEEEPSSTQSTPLAQLSHAAAVPTASAGKHE